jgi:hypothetical protein
MKRLYSRHFHGILCNTGYDFETHNTVEGRSLRRLSAHPMESESFPVAPKALTISRILFFKYTAIMRKMFVQSG